MMGAAGADVDIRPTSVNYLGADISFDGTNPTSSTISFGTPSSNRIIFAGLGIFGDDSGASTLTIGGVSATLVGTSGGNNCCAQLWYAAVPTGTSGVVTGTGMSFADAAVGLVSVYGGNSLLNSIATSSTTLNMNVLPFEALIGVGFTNNSSSWSLTGLTSHINVDIRSGEYFVIGSHLTSIAESPRVISASAGSVEDRDFVLARWGTS